MALVCFTTCYRALAWFYRLLPWTKPTIPPATMAQAYLTTCYHGPRARRNSSETYLKISHRLQAQGVAERFNNFLHLHEWRATFLWFLTVPSGSFSIIKKSFKQGFPLGCLVQSLVWKNPAFLLGSQTLV